MARDEDYRRLIHTSRWLRLRRDVLSAHPLCQDCLERGELTPACEVHHVRPVEEAAGYAGKARLMYDPANLRALCHACHVARHVEMGRSGKEATRRRNLQRLEDITNKFFNGV